jgi:hypothetical protein
MLVGLLGFINGRLDIAQRTVLLFELSLGDFPERAHLLAFGLEEVSFVPLSLELLAQFIILAPQLHIE